MILMMKLCPFYFPLGVKIQLSLPMQVASSLTILKRRPKERLRSQVLATLAVLLPVLLGRRACQLLIELLLLKLAIDHPPSALHLS